MYASTHGSGRPKSSGGPEMYFGYCQRSQRYRMMDLPDYVSSMQEGMSRWMNDSTSAYQDAMRRYSEMPRGPMMPQPMQAPWKQRTRDCSCDDCHCECCVCDADVLMHARCGEMRRIPVTFENDTRREREVKLELGKFVSAGGRDLGWPATLSETQFKLHSCDEHTVSLFMHVICREKQTAVQPGDKQPAVSPAPTDRTALFTAVGSIDRFGTVDRCEVGYATIRAEGCLTRPIVVAVAVLPDDCDAYRHPCGCGCCD